MHTLEQITQCFEQKFEHWVENNLLYHKNQKEEYVVIDKDRIESPYGDYTITYSGRYFYGVDFTAGIKNYPLVEIFWEEIDLGDSDLKHDALVGEYPEWVYGDMIMMGMSDLNIV